MKVMIATPAGGGMVHIPYLVSFAATVKMLTENNVAVQPLVVKSSSLLVAERNRLLQAFWDSDCTHMLCIDADIGWPAEAVMAFLREEKDFLACCYPARTEENMFIFRPVTNADGSLKTEQRFIHMEYVPAGFMLLSRSAIEKMRTAHPDLYFKTKNPNAESHREGFCLFNTELYDGEFWGEDYVFCRRAREAGLDILVDPLVKLDHAGKVGALIEVLVDKNGQRVSGPSKTVQEAA